MNEKCFAHGCRSPMEPRNLSQLSKYSQAIPCSGTDDRSTEWLIHQQKKKVSSL